MADDPTPEDGSWEPVWFGERPGVLVYWRRSLADGSFLAVEPTSGGYWSWSQRVPGHTDPLAEGEEMGAGAALQAADKYLRAKREREGTRGGRR